MKFKKIAMQLGLVAVGFAGFFLFTNMSPITVTTSVSSSASSSSAQVERELTKKEIASLLPSGKGCIISSLDCPQNPNYANLNFADFDPLIKTTDATKRGGATTAVACDARAIFFAGYCGTRNPMKASYYEQDQLVSYKLVVDPVRAIAEAKSTTEVIIGLPPAPPTPPPQPVVGLPPPKPVPPPQPVVGLPPPKPVPPPQPVVGLPTPKPVPPPQPVVGLPPPKPVPPPQPVVGLPPPKPAPTPQPVVGLPPPVPTTKASGSGGTSSDSSRAPAASSTKK